MPNSKSKLHRTRKFYCMYRLQYINCFFPGKDWVLFAKNRTVINIFVEWNINLILI